MISPNARKALAEGLRRNRQAFEEICELISEVKWQRFHVEWIDMFESIIDEVDTTDTSVHNSLPSKPIPEVKIDELLPSFDEKEIPKKPANISGRYSTVVIRK
jgi:hypothetical protein